MFNEIAGRAILSYNTKAKDQSPERTINIIRNILFEAGIVTVEDWANPSKGCYWVNLRIANTNLFTNGKGTSEIFALASAYGELMERLQNLVIFRFSVGYTPHSTQKNQNAIFNDEQILGIDVILEQSLSLSDFFANEGASFEDKRKLMTRWLDIQNSQFSSCGSNEYNGLVCLPFLDIQTLKKCYVPVVPMDIMFGTNGMCAGNTVAETLVQGLSEIFERYVNISMLRERITPPDIPRDILKKYFKSYTLIEEVEKNTDFSIIVKDCSLGQGYPVIAIIFIDHARHSYFVKFGAHPILDIALERCATELFQGRYTNDTNWMKTCTYHFSKDINKQNMTEIIKNGNGIYPVEFFGDEPDYEYTNLHLKQVADSNEACLNEMINMVTAKGYDIYIRDWSYLGFPSYQIIIPHMSNIFESNVERLAWQESYCKARAATLQLPKLDSVRYEAISDFMNKNNYSNIESIGMIIDMPFFPDNPLNNLKRDIFHTLYAIKEESYADAYFFINRYIESEGVAASSSLKCLRACLGLLSEKVSDPQKIGRYLSAFYTRSKVDGIIKIVFKSSEIFDSYKISCPQCNKCGMRVHCYSENIQKIYNRLRDISIEKGLNQDNLLNFIKRIRQDKQEQI